MLVEIHSECSLGQTNVIALIVRFGVSELVWLSRVVNLQ